MALTPRGDEGLSMTGHWITSAEWDREYKRVREYKRDTKKYTRGTKVKRREMWTRQLSQPLASRGSVAGMTLTI